MTFKTIILTGIFGFLFGFSTTAKADENPEDTTSERVESINEKVFINSNDTKLYAEIKGKDKTKPVILFLHGGPGDVILGLLPFQAYAGKKLEEEYVVVYLHQRGLVKSLPVPDSTQTIENHISDVENVVNFLTKKLNRKKITLMGHSWGGLLGALYLMRDDSKIDKFIAIASPFNFKKVNSEGFKCTMKWAKSEQNEAAIKELSEKANPPINTFEKLMIKSKWASQANGGIAKNLSVGKILEESGYKEFDKEWQLTTLRVAKTMFDSLNKIDIEDDINQITVPILFMAGKNDTNVPPNTVHDAFDKYHHEKEFVLFENSHHLIYVDEPDLLVSKVKQFLAKGI